MYWNLYALHNELLTSSGVIVALIPVLTDINTDLLPNMAGASGVVSARNIGSATQKFQNLYVHDAYIDAGSLYVNDKKVIEDVSDTIVVRTDPDQDLAIKSFGIGDINLIAEHMVSVKGSNGVELLVPATLVGKSLTLSNLSSGGNVYVSAAGANADFQVVAYGDFDVIAERVILDADLTVTGTITNNGKIVVNTDYLSTVSGNIVSQIPSLSGYATQSWTVTQLTTVSGDIIDQMPSLSGYATESWVNLNFITSAQMTTISGDLVAQMGTGSVTEEQLTTTSGDIVDQIPSLSGYATTDYVDTQIAGINPGGGSMYAAATGSGIFTSSGTEVAHNVNDINHFLAVTPNIYSNEDAAKIGTIYINPGLNSDTVYCTGDTAVDGYDLAFTWMVSISGSSSSSSLDCAQCTSSGLVVDNSVISPSGIFTEGIQVGSGTVRITGEGIIFPDNSIITVAPPKIELFGAGLLLDLSLDPSSSVSNIGLFGNASNFEPTSGSSWEREAVGSNYCWKKTSAGGSLRLMPHHTQNSSGASFSAAVLTDGSASFTIVDTNNDLSVLFGMDTQPTSVRRAFKMDASSNAANRNFISGYIGNVTKNSNTYTFDIYNGPFGTTRNWHKYSLGSWTGADVTWTIYPAFFETDHDYLRGYAMSCWVYDTDVTTNWTAYMGKFDRYINGGEDIGWAYYFQHRDTDASLQCNIVYPTNVNSAVQLDNVLKNNRWAHFAWIQSRADSYRYIMVNGQILSATATAYANACAMGLFAFLGDGQGGSSQATDSKIAFPRFWSGDIQYGIIRQVYEYERNLMGLPPNH